MIQADSMMAAILSSNAHIVGLYTQKQCKPSLYLCRLKPSLYTSSDANMHYVTMSYNPIDKLSQFNKK